MAWRYRRSVRFPGGFRINLSRSGVGYSWGFRGFRIGKGAKGQITRTVSIPGTGIYNRTTTHYNKIVGALSETPRLTKRIDEVIDEHGGWHSAFASAQQTTN